MRGRCSVFLALAAAALLAGVLGISLVAGTEVLHRFIAISFLLFAGVLWAVALTSGIEKAPTKMFQWVFFVIIALTAWLGAW